MSPVELALGTFALSSLADYSMTFTVGPNAFITSDEVTSPNDVAVRITATGTGERLVFTENGMNGDSGPDGGSLDMVNSAGKILSFEPSSYGGHYLYLGSGYFGNFLALSAVSEPASWALLITGFGLTGATLRRRRSATSVGDSMF